MGDQLRPSHLEPLPGGWQRIELRHLLSLEAVAEEQSFVAAAARLGYVQSAVSHQLRALEELLGVRLVERTRGTRGGKLTPEGRAFLERARTILAEMRGAACELEQNDLVRLGAEAAVSIALLAPAFRRADTTLEIDEGIARDDLLATVMDGRRDAGCIVGEAPPGFSELPFHRDRWVVATPRGERFDGLSTLTHIALRGVTPSFPLAGELPRAVGMAESPATLAAMVHAGIGAAVVPASLVQPWRAQLDIAPIESTTDLSFTVCLVWARNRTPKRALRLLTSHLSSA